MARLKSTFTKLKNRTVMETVQIVVDDKKRKLRSVCSVLLPSLHVIGQYDDFE